MKPQVLIIGGGIGGLTLALKLNQLGIACVLFEAAPEIKPLGVGINLLPHAMGELADLGLEELLRKLSVSTQEAVFYNRFGQLIYREPLGTAAGYRYPQLSIHRGDLQLTLLTTVRERLGKESIFLDRTCTGFDQNAAGVTAHFRTMDGQVAESHLGDILIACDGIHSAVRKQLFPQEGPGTYSGFTGWRGVTRMKPFFDRRDVPACWLVSYRQDHRVPYTQRYRRPRPTSRELVDGG